MTTFDELTRKSKHNLACAVLRNSKDGKRWGVVHKNAFKLITYLDKCMIDANLLCEIYNIPNTIIKLKTDEH